MNENDNQLLQQFFSEAARQEVADDGFTQRVMKRIDAHHATAGPGCSVLNAQRLWTLFCLLVAGGLFLWLHDWNTLASYVLLLLTHLEVFLRTLPTALDPSALSFGPGVLTQGFIVEIMLSLFVLMALSIIGLTRWANRQVS